MSRQLTRVDKHIQHKFQLVTSSLKGNYHVLWLLINETENSKRNRASLPIKQSESHSLSCSSAIEHLLGVTVVSQTSKQTPLCSWGYEENDSSVRERTRILEMLAMKAVHSPLPLSKGCASLSGWKHQWSSQQACLVINGLEQWPHRDPSLQVIYFCGYIWRFLALEYYGGGMSQCLGTAKYLGSIPAQAYIADRFHSLGF